MTTSRQTKTIVGSRLDRRAQAASPAQACLGDPHPASARRTRPRLAMFNVAIDSKLRGCDLVELRVADIDLGDSVRLRTMVVQQKTRRAVPFELTDPTRDVLTVWLKKRGP